jgi:ParB/RepB/Spo0J family partition protein
MTTFWRPSEIIINEAVRNDPITKHILSLCTDLEYSIKNVSDSKPETIRAASEILSIETDSILHSIMSGKLVMHITGASNNVLDTFVMEDPRMMCPEFDKLVLASNGCFYNCDWCFLKGTYRANQNYITVRVQYDKIKDMLTKRLKAATAPVMFDTGEMADSLSMEHLTKSGQELIPWFAEQEHGYMYMLTKSTNIDSILKLKHNKHTILAWSVNAPIVADWFEVGAPKPRERLRAAKLAQKAGYPIRIRLDPIIPVPNWQQYYSGIIKSIFEEVKPERITLGTLRFEGQFYKMRDVILSHPKLKEIVGTMVPMLDEIKLHGGGKSIGKYSFPVEQRIEIFKFAIEEIRKYSECDIALCKETSEVWEAVELDLKECKCVCQYDCADMVNRPEKEVVKMVKGKKPGLKEVAAAQKSKKAAKITPAVETPKSKPAPVKPKFVSLTYEKGKIYNISLDELKTDSKTQPRKHFDAAEMEDMKNSIESQGLIYPIIFRVNDKDKPVLVSGERRVKAHLELNKATIPGIYIDSDKYDEIALVDNVQRVDLHPVDEADAVNNLKSKYEYTQEQIGNLIGKAHNTVSDILALTKLSGEIRDDARTRKSLSRSALLKVARKKKAPAQKKAYDALIASLAKQGESVKRPRHPAHIRAIATTDRTIKCIKDINLDSLGRDRAGVEAKLRELLAEIQTKLGTTAT